MEQEVVVDFFGVYLLCCTNPQHPGRTYVGYTRDPRRRLAQHNRGVWAGGAHRTNNRGPWKMVMIIHGFPNNIAALRFEWAWQHPETSTRLQHVAERRRARGEKELPHRLRILSEMLRTGPWRRLPLTVRWLEPDYVQPLPVQSPIPDHMAIKHGAVKIRNFRKKPVNSGATSKEPKQRCSICYSSIDADNSKLQCLGCCSNFHIICLADAFLTDGEYVPIEGTCPKCETILLWGDLIRNMKCDKSNDIISCIDSEPGSDEELSQGFSLDDDVEKINDDEF